MRPPGEIRLALTTALRQLYAAGQQPVTAHAIAAKANVGFDQAKDTLENMARAGHIAIGGHDKPAGQRWQNLYEPPRQDIGDTPLPWGGIEALAEVMQGFTKSSES